MMRTPTSRMGGREMSLLVTPVILTLDEAPNIERALNRLRWAAAVVVIDSGSADGTQELAQAFDNVQVVEHAFIDFETHWNFAISEESRSSTWILALDSDYVLSDEFVESLRRLPQSPDVDAYHASFSYCVHERAPRGSLYQTKVVLFDATCARFVQRGHTQVPIVDGTVDELSGPILNDDRKSRPR
jgi:glycosyltransferase involved in cell wall biosynthesis